jgi:DUF438 domain-containing protein
MQLELPPGHPVDTFLRENEALRHRVQNLRAAIAKLGDSASGVRWEEILASMREAYRDLAKIELHFQRKEGLWFPCLERYGITGPSTVMWGVDDQIRGRLASIGHCLQHATESVDQLHEAAQLTIEPALEEIEKVIKREERDLVPMALDTFREQDWGEIWRRSPEFGWCLVEPRTGYLPPDEPTATPITDDPMASSVVFPTGRLTVKELQLIFPTLPLDFSFIDADDRVRFYSLGPEPIFTRVKTDLGQKVEDCHPPKSVPLVKRILSDFRAGKHDVIDSWIHHEGKYAHIRYFAVRDEQGEYVGTLEMVQDIKPLQQLTGECRLLQYTSSDSNSVRRNDD